jgi:hypothetical protein
MQRKPNSHVPLVNGQRDPLDLDALLHPAGAFAHPMDVVRDPELTTYEKRAILASWASDSCAVEAEPALRRAPGGRPVRFDEVMDALQVLDRGSVDGEGRRRHDRFRRLGRAFLAKRSMGGPGHALN